MPSLYRRVTKDSDGKAKRAAVWTVEFRTAAGRLCRLAAFKDRRASAELGETVEALLACRATGSRPDADLSRRVERLPFRVLDRLREWGVLDPRYSAAVKPLSEHVGDWERSLTASGRTEKHVSGSAGAVRELLESLGWCFWSDLDAGEAENALAKLRTEGRELRNGKRRRLSARRSNAMLGALRQFARWMVREGRAAENPLERLRPLNVETDRRHVRRAFRIEELRRLIAAAEGGPEVRGMLGPERGLLYRLAAETGLRAGELRALTRGSFDLDGLTVTVEAATAKNRRRDVLPVRAETAVLLGRHLAMRAPAAPAFPLPKPHHTAEMIRADMDAAGIARVDEAGRVLDFHSLRSSCATMLADAGVPLTTAQAILRHSDPRLTAKVYTTRFRDTEAAAVARLPDFGATASEGGECIG
jgi:integrase